jgi:hypothetical protein
VVAEQQPLAQGLVEGVLVLGYMLGTLYVSPTMALSPGVEGVVVEVAVVDLGVGRMLKLLIANQEKL